jgi:hypothetical protein
VSRSALFENNKLKQTDKALFFVFYLKCPSQPFTLSISENTIYEHRLNVYCCVTVCDMVQTRGQRLCSNEGEGSTARDTRCVSGRPQGDPAPSARKEFLFQADAEGGLGHYRERKGGVHVFGPNDDVLITAESRKHQCAVRCAHGAGVHLL